MKLKDIALDIIKEQLELEEIERLIYLASNYTGKDLTKYANQDWASTDDLRTALGSEIKEPEKVKKFYADVKGSEFEVTDFGFRKGFGVMNPDPKYYANSYDNSGPMGLRMKTRLQNG